MLDFPLWVLNRFADLGICELKQLYAFLSGLPTTSFSQIIQHPLASYVLCAYSKMQIASCVFTFIFNIIIYRNKIMNLSFMETVEGKKNVRENGISIFNFFFGHKSHGMTKEPGK